MTKQTYISIDIEAALIRGKQYCIEIGAVKYQPDGAIDTFSQLIQPYKFKKLNRHITALTGITSEQLYDAPSFKDVMRDFKAWCGEKAVFLTFGEFDRKVLSHNLVLSFKEKRKSFKLISSELSYNIPQTSSNSFI